MEENTVMIKKDTIEYRLVSLIGLAGEIKTDELYKLNYGKEYIRKTICRLNSNGFIKVYQYLGRKYLRLTSKCKKYLSSNFPERFSDCFAGATSTNKIRNDDYRRERYHRLGEVLVMLNLADIKIFPDEKTLMKNTHGFTRADYADLSDYCVEKNTAEFYSSAELKSAGLFMNARTSRALGIIYSHPEVYIIYNVADGVFKWENKVEESFFFRAGQTFLGDLNRNRDSYAKMIFVGKNMWTFENLLATKSSIKSIFNRQSHCDNIYFLDSSKFAPQQIKYFINKSTRDEIEKRIRGYFSIKKNYYRYYDAMDDGTAVVNCTTCNLVAIKHVKELLVNEGEKVIIIYFHFQLPYLQNYFGEVDNVEYCQFGYADMFGE